jgi:ketosteroid isomerase-like protein
MFTNRSLDRRPTAEWRFSAMLRRSRLVVPLVALCALAAAGTGASAAEKLNAADRQAIEQTIRHQLDAFNRDDAERAFNFATPDIQRMFGSSDRFMRMVRDNYEPVYRPASVRFIRVDLTDGQWVQTVQITDEEGRVWRALFTMRRQPDRGWKVGGCQLQETSALET